MSEYNRFLTKSRIKAGEEDHRLKILKAIATYEAQVDEMRPRQFTDWEQARRTTAKIKAYVLDNLPALLEEFESKIIKRGAKVWWARNKDEAQKYFLTIAERHQAKKVVKSKSMTTEEI